jgi:hypothetical protein
VSILTNRSDCPGGAAPVFAVRQPIDAFVAHQLN